MSITIIMEYIDDHFEIKPSNKRHAPVKINIVTRLHFRSGYVDTYKLQPIYTEVCYTDRDSFIAQATAIIKSTYREFKHKHKKFAKIEFVRARLYTKDTFAFE